MKGVTKYQIFLGSDTQRCKLLMRKDVDNFLTCSLKILIPLWVLYKLTEINKIPRYFEGGFMHLKGFISSLLKLHNCALKILDFHGSFGVRWF